MLQLRVHHVRHHFWQFEIIPSLHSTPARLFHSFELNFSYLLPFSFCQKLWKTCSEAFAACNLPIKRSGTTLKCFLFVYYIQLQWYEGMWQNITRGFCSKRFAVPKKKKAMKSRKKICISLSSEMFHDPIDLLKFRAVLLRFLLSGKYGKLKT